MDFSRWLSAWLTRHPLKDTADPDPARYTAEVMARVRALQPQPASAASPIRWLPWPRLALTLATVAAGLLMAVGVVRQSDTRLAESLAREAAVLASFEESALESVVPENDRLAGEMETLDLLVLAEAPPGEDAWVDETLQLLDQLDEQLPAEETGSSEDWLEELEMIDENELAASS